MAKAHVDRITFLSARKVRGIITELRRKAIITGLTVDDGNDEAYADYTVLYGALAAVGITDESQPDTEDGANLVLREMNPRMVSKTAAEVELVYTHFQDGEQSLDHPIYGKVYIQVKYSLQQVVTDKYPDDYGNWDPETTPEETAAKAKKKSLQGKEITVKHTYPDGTDAFTYIDGNGVKQTLPADPDYATRHQVQVKRGEIQVFEPRIDIVIKGCHDVNYIAELSAFFNRKVNSNEWYGKPPGTWFCLNADYALIKTTSPYRARFTLEFQHSPAGWQPDVRFIDERTGRAPAGLIENVGYKTIDYYPAVDYNRYFEIFG